MLRSAVRCRGLLRVGLMGLMLTLSLGAAQAAETLNAAGATFPYPLYSKWFDAYKQKTGVTISYQSIGSGGGIKALQTGVVDIGASDAPLSDQEAKEMGAAVVHIPTVAGAVVIAYALPGVDKGLRLTPDVLADIYLGKLTRWNDRRITSVNPGRKLPNLAIAVVHRSDGSGTSYIFTSYLSAISADWKRTVGAGKSVSWPAGIGGKGNEGVAGLVKQTPGAIGYVELAYATQNKLPCAFLRNRAGRFVEPTLASTTAAAAGAAKAMQKDVRVSIVNSPAKDAYPIAGFTYMLVYRNQRDANRGRATADFLWWAVHTGQQEAPRLEYAPLPAAVVKINEGAIRSLSSGGKALLAR
jgi:phosphate transport system substrate-binding protein